MKIEENKFHSCYDELLAYLFNNLNNELLEISNKLTAHEIIIYSLLLHKCIDENNEESVISYAEIQRLRKKRCGRSKLLDDLTSQAYDRAIYGLANKIVRYDIANKRKKYKITYKQHEHPLLIINNVEVETNGNKNIYYSLGPFGKTLLESKRYSTLVPKKYFQLNFNETTTYQIALYVCRIIYIERRKKKNSSTITLKSLLSNINKFSKYNNELISVANCYDYKGSNKKRLYENTINKTKALLDDLIAEQLITNYEYMNNKWIINYNN